MHQEIMDVHEDFELIEPMGDDDVVLMSDEFSLAKDGIPLLEQHKKRIEDLFEVEIDYGVTALDGKMQWVCVTGDDENRTKARDYVRALCNPEETMTVDYPPALHPLLSRFNVHEKLEKQSRTVIIFLSIGTAQIQGNDGLSVTLALSSIEDLITKFQTEQTNNPDAARSPSARQASLRLESELRRLSSENRSMDYDEDYSRMPDAVKRTILGWFLEETSPESEALESMADLQQAADEISDAYDARTSRDKNAFYCNSSNNDSPPIDSSLKGFWDLGKENGYSDDDIASVLRVFGEQLSNDEFLMALNTQKGSNNEPEDESSQEAASRNPMEEVLNGQNPDTPKKKTKKSRKKNKAKETKKEESAHDAYLQLLSRDFQEEDDALGIDAYKERSAQRIQLLQQALDMEPVITDVRVNHKDTNDDEEGIAVDDTDWKMVPDHKKGRRGRSVPYASRHGGDTGKQEPYNTYQQNQVKQFEQGDYLAPNQRGVSPRRGAASGRSYSPQNPQSPTKYNRGYRGKSPNRHSPNRQPHFQQDRHSPSRRRSPGRQSPRHNAQPIPRPDPPGGASVPLRYVIIDGSNVAMSHANGKYFSCRGIEICVNYFLKRGHKEVTVFVPQWRTQSAKPGYPIQDQQILHELKQTGHLVFTPARRVPGKNIVCYDDRFVIRLAIETDGIIVSNDNYRDLWYENVEYRKIIENRLLPYSFVGDFFMPPDDPLGRDGPHIDQFLSKMDEDDYRLPNPQPHFQPRNNFGDQQRGQGQPRGRPQQVRGRGNQNFAPQMINPRGRGNQNAVQHQQRGHIRGGHHRFPPPNPSNSVPQPVMLPNGSPTRQPNRLWLRAQLQSVFPQNEAIIDQVLQEHPDVINLNKLSSYVLEILSQ